MWPDDAARSIRQALDLSVSSFCVFFVCLLAAELA
jgi:hypothetical protein